MAFNTRINTPNDSAIESSKISTISNIKNNKPRHKAGLFTTLKTPFKKAYTKPSFIALTAA